MMSEIKSLMPQTSLYYSLILPRINDSFIHGIDVINTAMVSFCHTINVKIITHNEFGRDGKINSALFRNDVIHPSYKGTSIFARDIIFTYRNYRHNFVKTSTL